METVKYKIQKKCVQTSTFVSTAQKNRKVKNRYEKNGFSVKFITFKTHIYPVYFYKLIN